MSTDTAAREQTNIEKAKETALKNCPFCGKLGKVHKIAQGAYNGMYQPRCINWQECFAGSVFMRRDMAVRVWNTRHAAANAWVRASEGLPEDSGEYVVTLWSAGEPNYFESVTAHFDGFSKWKHGNLNLTPDVIAWMPLPEPFTEDSK